MKLFSVSWTFTQPWEKAHARWLESERHEMEMTILAESETEVTQSCPTLCDPMDCSLPGSSVRGIFHTIVLEWIAISFSSGSSQPRDGTQVSHIVDRRFTIWATREVIILAEAHSISGKIRNTHTHTHTHTHTQTQNLSFWTQLKLLNCRIVS